MKITFLRPAILKSMIMKEFRQILRDRRMRMMLFGSPVLMLLLFGYAVNTDISNVKIAVLDRDRSSQSREIVRKFTAGGYFTVQSYVYKESDADRLLDTGEAELLIHIPVNFSRNLKSGKHSAIQIIVDGTDSSRASVILSYLNLITSEYSTGFMTDLVRGSLLARGGVVFRQRQPVSIRERIMFNPDLTSRNFYLPGVLGLLIALITIMLTSMSVVKERESGTIEQIIVSPITSGEFVAGKTLPFALIGLLEICIITAIAIYWFGTPFNGNLFFLLFSGIFYIICTLSVGLFISTVSHTQQQAMLSTFLFFIPSIMLSGFVFPIYAMPEFFQYVTLLNPMRYFMVIIRGIFLKGVGFSILWKEVAALALLGSVLISLSIRRFNRRLE